MLSRNSKAASLALIAVFGFVITLIGVSIYFLITVFGGFRNLQNATDAGNLNAAKEALKLPYFPLQDSAYADFSGLVDPSSGAMDLQMYNRVVGQAYLVAMNALADRPQGQPGGQPSQQGITDAMLVTRLANGTGREGTVGLGKKLDRLFEDNSSSNPLFTTFLQVANRNSMRMFQSDSQIQNDYSGWHVSFMGAGESTNVYINNDPSQTNLPYIGDTGIRANDPSSPLSSLIQGTLTNNQAASSNSFYLAGYSAFNFGPNWTLYGVPVFPGIQPHHVSGSDFTLQLQKNETIFQGVVPPNAYESGAMAVEQAITKKQTRAEAYAIVGAQDNIYPASIPHGFIVIYNPPGAGTNNIVDTTDNVFGKELMEGIYLATTNSGGAAFSTNEQSLENWVNYNSGKGNGSMPSVEGIFFTNPSDSATSIASMTYGGDHQPVCIWTFVSGDQANDTCACLEPDFNSAYPPALGTETGDGTALMAVEQLKKAVIQKYSQMNALIPCPNPSSGLRLWQLARNPSVTGAAARMNNNIPKNNPRGAQISIDGTLAQLLDEVMGNAPAQINLIYNQMAQRMQEIDPGTTIATAVKWLHLQNTPLPLGSTWYIYHDGAGWHFQRATDPGFPKWMPSSPPASDILPDGSLQEYVTKYQTVDELVNPPHEEGIHDHLYTQFNTRATPGFDVVYWQPSSGYKNELGQLTFYNFCGGVLAGKTPAPQYDAPD